MEKTSEPKRGKKVFINRDKFLSLLKEIDAMEDLVEIKNRVTKLKNTLVNYKNDEEGLLNINSDGDTITRREDVLLSELGQILDSRTVERAKYYLKRTKNGVQGKKTNKINDINLALWKEYDEIITDSLWVLEKRDTSGAHLGWYWGNFIPQIPRQLLLRYTKKGEWIIDPFLGSGTTLIECRRLGRNGIGIEINKETAQKAIELIEKENNPHNVETVTISADSSLINLNKVLREKGIKKAQFIVFHPPYFDIIKFSDEPQDLSNARNVESFLKGFGAILDNVLPYLESGRYFAVVIGDKYSKGEWIPLGFLCMQ